MDKGDDKILVVVVVVVVDVNLFDYSEEKNVCMDGWKEGWDGRMRGK